MDENGRVYLARKVDLLEKKCLLRSNVSTLLSLIVALTASD